MYGCICASFLAACLVAVTVPDCSGAYQSDDSCKDKVPFQTGPPNPCSQLICFEGQWHEIHSECPDLQCVDSVMGDDHCCPMCPYGPNCEKEGVIIPLDTVITLDSGEQCQCIQEGRGPPTTICIDAPVPEYY